MARKKAFAIWVNSAGSGRPATCPSLTRNSRSLVLIVVIDSNVFEHADRVFCQHGSRAVERDEIRRNGIAIDPHEPNRKARSLFARKSWLKESHHPLALFPGAEKQN